MFVDGSDQVHPALLSLGIVDDYRGQVVGVAHHHVLFLGLVLTLEEPGRLRRGLALNLSSNSQIFSWLK